MIVMRLVCFFLGCRWRTVLMNMSKFVMNMHMHSQAGCWSICTRCRYEWNDLWWICLPRSEQRIVPAPRDLEYM